MGVQNVPLHVYWTEIMLFFVYFLSLGNLDLYQYVYDQYVYGLVSIRNLTCMSVGVYNAPLLVYWEKYIPFFVFLSFDNLNLYQYFSGLISIRNLTCMSVGVYNLLLHVYWEKYIRFFVFLSFDNLHLYQYICGLVSIQSNLLYILRHWDCTTQNIQTQKIQCSQSPL